MLDNNRPGQQYYVIEMLDKNRPGHQYYGTEMIDNKLPELKMNLIHIELQTILTSEKE